ncbi:hypothetical protein [uncultured Nevskia sp.]|uniref:hypothetical protein n=1 Tax=uncultured Nevskia sp. TaxID=228950 RepID=UPI0025E91D71|nr:hypothetical protein [uncultured Nevskia sp.]
MKQPYFVRVALAKVGFALAKKASRNQTWFDRLARRVLERVLHFNFDLDEMVLTDQGYDPDELERYQKGL